MRRAQPVIRWYLRSEVDNIIAHVGLPTLEHAKQSALATALRSYKIEDMYVIVHILVTLYHLDLYE